jgi:hypothetical protein
MVRIHVNRNIVFERATYIAMDIELRVLWEILNFLTSPDDISTYCQNR